MAARISAPKVGEYVYQGVKIRPSGSINRLTQAVEQRNSAQQAQAQAAVRQPPNGAAVQGAPQAQPSPAQPPQVPHPTPNAAGAAVQHRSLAPAPLVQAGYERRTLNGNNQIIPGQETVYTGKGPMTRRQAAEQGVPIIDAATPTPAPLGLPAGADQATAVSTPYNQPQPVQQGTGITAPGAGPAGQPIGQPAPSTPGQPAIGTSVSALSAGGQQQGTTGSDGKPFDGSTAGTPQSNAPPDWIEKNFGHLLSSNNNPEEHKTSLQEIEAATGWPQWMIEEKLLYQGWRFFKNNGELFYEKGGDAGTWAKERLYNSKKVADYLNSAEGGVDAGKINSHQTDNNVKTDIATKTKNASDIANNDMFDEKAFDEEAAQKKYLAQLDNTASQQQAIAASAGQAQGNTGYLYTGQLAGQLGLNQRTQEAQIDANTANSRLTLGRADLDRRIGALQGMLQGALSDQDRLNAQNQLSEMNARKAQMDAGAANEGAPSAGEQLGAGLINGGSQAVGTAIGKSISPVTATPSTNGIGQSSSALTAAPSTQQPQSAQPTSQAKPPTYADKFEPGTLDQAAASRYDTQQQNKRYEGDYKELEQNILNILNPLAAQSTDTSGVNAAERKLNSVAKIKAAQDQAKALRGRVSPDKFNEALSQGNAKQGELSSIQSQQFLRDISLRYQDALKKASTAEILATHTQDRATKEVLARLASQSQIEAQQLQTAYKNYFAPSLGEKLGAGLLQLGGGALGTAVGKLI